MLHFRVPRGRSPCQPKYVDENDVAWYERDLFIGDRYAGPVIVPERRGKGSTSWNSFFGIGARKRNRKKAPRPQKYGLGDLSDEPVPLDEREKTDLRVSDEWFEDFCRRAFEDYKKDDSGR